MEQYIILKKTSVNLPKGHWTYIAMIDRRKSKDAWWTVKSCEAYKYNSKKSAEYKAKSLKYGPFIVIKESDFDKYVDRDFHKVRRRNYDSLTAQIATKAYGFDSDGNEVSEYGEFYEDVDKLY